eukprot:CAMPEP_0197662116 /NCGR_PEP_ID=MMETSP1338-20131121/52167_1 /TAXON_ID=43686 ORGANISM="Pelagodinium beii, Strain RCC1491" /NCGR_SAMPLE_ID=MMETSP1338 /ASSEMBLY_ACC=CAM_ASM_000754 /LENGTH=123 /DNA_ID=CAMNT_0043239831 /DNA_START=45 /DNA_END=416 /DNA_ORIENTATION=-
MQFLIHTLAFFTCAYSLAVQQQADERLSPSNLHSAMQSLMQDDDDQEEFFSGGARRGVKVSSEMDEEDPYMQDSADGLSKALGPRWTKEKIESDADRKTSAFLKGISGNKELNSLSRMMAAMR